MNTSFPRILALLRKENNISQKQAASDLKISQALLSHYEKGIRECGLDFVVRTADYYNVSCDYLLGRSPDRNGATLSVEDIPDEEAAGKENVLKGGSILPVLNKKLIVNSLNIIFDLLAKSKNKQLINEVSMFLMLSVYRAFRILHSANPKNHENFFTVPKSVAGAKAAAKMLVNEATAYDIAHSDDPKHNGELNSEALAITNDKLAKDYPLFSSSLLNLIQNCENAINKPSE